MNCASRTSLNYLFKSRFSIKYRNIRNICGVYASTNINSLNLINCTNFSQNERIFRNPNILFRRFYADYPEHTIIKLPNLSPTMETGSLVSWARKAGDSVAEGDLLAEIETDKATMAMDASEDGYLAKILIEAGTKDIPIGTPLCVMVEEESDIEAFKDFKPPQSSETTSKAPEPVKTVESKPTPAATVAPVQSQTVNTSSSMASKGGRIIASPLAKKMAREQGIDLSKLQGTGPGGRIVAADVEQQGAAGSMPVSATNLDMSQMDLAQRMVESKRNVPHYYLTADVCIDRLLDVKTQLDNLSSKKSDASSNKLSLNDFIVKAAARACVAVPEANSEWRDTAIRQYASVDINVAMATQSGLVMPVVHNAQSIGIKEINEKIKGYVEKGKENNLSANDVQGGTFTVSNLGMFPGVTSCSAIINPPQACILAVGASQQKLVADDSNQNGFRKSNWLSVTLCCDHRVVDGAVGAQWLQHFKANIEEPTMMLL